jgi:hypothetical protein
MSGKPPISKLNAAEQADRDPKDITVIHTIQADTYLRHHGQETARIVERYQRRRAAVSRKRPGPRANPAASA